MATLEIKDLHVSVDTEDGPKEILKGVNLMIRDECSHAAIPLSEGDIDHCHVECWLHGSRFDLRTGKPTGLPATEPVPVFPVQIDGDDVLIDLNTNLGDN